jgi:hypothetical protein
MFTHVFHLRELKAYVNGSFVCLGSSLERFEGVAGGRGIDRTHHASRAMRCGEELLAEEPDGRGIVSNSQVPLGNIGDTGSRDEDVSRIETTRDGSTGFSERRLGYRVVSRDASEFERDDRALRSSNRRRNELEVSAIRRRGGATNLDDGVLCRGQQSRGQN